VLLVNPTHLAVALRYDPVDGAPRVIAKGADRIADKLREIAGRNGIPITADKPLARTLFRTVRVGQHVPADLYEAVAVVLAVAYRRSGRGPASRPMAGPGAPRRRQLVRAAA
jgi:flagellar biosynthesis protein FlhB